MATVECGQVKQVRLQFHDQLNLNQFQYLRFDYFRKICSEIVKFMFKKCLFLSTYAVKILVQRFEMVSKWFVWPILYGSWRVKWEMSWEKAYLTQFISFLMPVSSKSCGLTCTIWFVSVVTFYNKNDAYCSNTIKLLFQLNMIRVKRLNWARQ